ncbi:MAG: HEPN domain-containing protein [Actinomycetia bacterium]|nr:HEPN domain-containing protein [Actinomycetes bacterium]
MEQAALDLDAAEDVQSSHPHVACFLAQQAAEKAVKALLYAQGADKKTGHSISDLLTRIRGAEDLISASDALALDLLSQATRYPDALQGGVPAKLFTATQAAEALDRARRIVGACGQMLAALGESGPDGG